MRWVVTSFTVCLAYKPEDESVQRVCWTDTEKIKKCSIYHELSFSLLFWPPCSRYTVSVQRGHWLQISFARHRNCSLNILAKKTCWQKFFRRSFKISLTNVSLVFSKSFSKTGIRTSFLWDETNSYGKAVNIFLLPCQAWVHLKIPLTEKFMCSIFSFLSMQCLIYFQLCVWWRNE